jgi:hypothetical protein
VKIDGNPQRDLTGILNSIKQREQSLVSNRVEELVCPILGTVEHLREVARIIPRKDKATSNPRSPNVLFNIGLAIEMRNMSETALGLFDDVME